MNILKQEAYKEDCSETDIVKGSVGLSVACILGVCSVLQGCAKVAETIIYIPDSCNNPTFLPIEIVKPFGNEYIKDNAGVLTVVCEKTSDGTTQVLYYGNIPLDEYGKAEEFEVARSKYNISDTSELDCDLPSNCANPTIEGIIPEKNWFAAYGKPKFEGTIPITCTDEKGRKSYLEKSGLTIDQFLTSNPAINLKTGGIQNGLSCN